MCDELLVLLVFVFCVFVKLVEFEKLYNVLNVKFE